MPNPEQGSLFVGGFASFHGSGGNFVFGDGSVRFLPYSIEPSTLRKLTHRDDGEFLTGDDWNGFW
jgi:prepilin-type processing-associated H-X9-DG protein